MTLISFPEGEVWTEHSKKENERTKSLYNL
jgi:hypothetical protein